MELRGNARWINAGWSDEWAVGGLARKVRQIAFACWPVVETRCACLYLTAARMLSCAGGRSGVV